MLHVTSVLFDANASSAEFSRCYDESWVEKLYRGFRRNLTMDFRFVLFTDRPRRFVEPVEQIPLASNPPTWAACIEPLSLGEPQIFVGLDTLITGNIDALGCYALDHPGGLALPRDPHHKERSINGVVIAGAKMGRLVFECWDGKRNDMEHMREFPWHAIDDLWPGWVVSCKANQVRDFGLRGARIVYFHGRPKPLELVEKYQWVRDHWR